MIIGIFIFIAAVVGGMVAVFWPKGKKIQSPEDGIQDVKRLFINRTTFSMVFTLLYFVLDYLVTGPVWLVAFIVGFGSGETPMYFAFFVMFAIMTFLIRLMVPRTWLP